MREEGCILELKMLASDRHTEKAIFSKQNNLNRGESLDPHPPAKEAEDPLMLEKSTQLSCSMPAPVCYRDGLTAHGHAKVSTASCSGMKRSSLGPTHFIISLRWTRSGTSPSPPVDFQVGQQGHTCM